MLSANRDSCCTSLLQGDSGSFLGVFVLNEDSMALIPHTATDSMYDLGKIIHTQILDST